MREIIVTKAEAGQRFDRYLQKYMPGAANGFLHKMLRKKNIKLNGRKAEGKEKIKEGDAIQIFFSEETLAKFTGTSAGNRAVPGKEGTGAGTNGETAPERKKTGQSQNGQKRPGEWCPAAAEQRKKRRCAARSACSMRRKIF